MEPTFPYVYEGRQPIAGLRARFDGLAPGTETSETVRVAGRVRTVRTHGKVAFADLHDERGRIQLFAQQSVLGDEGMASFERIGVGDIVGAEGEIMMTRRGELSVRVTETEVLAPCSRPMPDNWHGLTDVEVRYRQRHLDLIVNPDARRIVDARAATNVAIRSFMSERGFVEVETPLLHPIAGGAVARPFVTHQNALDTDLYLRIAPELYLKRMLVGGLERVYELNRSFRNEGLSPRHLSEFTMLEAYEAYVDYNHTMALVEDLVRVIAEAAIGSSKVETGNGSIDFATEFRRLTMFEAIREIGGPDLEAVWRAEDFGALETAALDLGVATHPSWLPGKLLAEIYEQAAERTLITPTFITGYPKDVSPLAKDHRDIPGFTEQADLIAGGVEMTAIYSELNDPAEQRRRFERQARDRAAGDEEAAEIDEDFLDALAYGMPPAGGFGLGIDRLLTLLLGASTIREVVLFPILKPR